MITKKTIYIIRHGQTDFNKKGIIQGAGVDSDLNETGRKQALKFYKAYHHIPFDKIYTSQLKRTQQSIAPFVRNGYEFEALSELNEINWGIFEGMVGTPESKLVYKRIIKDWKDGLLDKAVEGGETPFELMNRLQGALDKIVSRPENTLLISMHGRAMRSFLCLLTQTPLRQMDQFLHNNLCLYQLEQKEKKVFEIIEFNNQDHLIY